METKLIAAKSELAISAALSCTFFLQNVCLAVARWKMIEAEFGFWGEWQQETTQVLQDPAPPNESTKSRRFGNLAIQIGAHPLTHPICRSAIERHRCRAATSRPPHLSLPESGAPTSVLSRGHRTVGLIRAQHISLLFLFFFLLTNLANLPLKHAPSIRRSASRREVSGFAC